MKTIKEYLENRIIKVSAVLIAATTIMGMLWQAGDYTGVRPVIKKEFEVIEVSQQQLTDSILQIRFTQLIMKKQFGDLTFLEQQELCKIAKQLDYVGVPGCSIFEFKNDG